MSFVWLAVKPLRTKEQVAQEIHKVSLARGLDKLATILAVMCVSQEAGANLNGQREFWCPANHADEESFTYPHDSVSDDGRSVGYFQQQKSPTGALWWGTTQDEMTLSVAANNFLDRLADDYTTATTPQRANDFIQRVQGSGVPNAYGQWWDLAHDVVNRALAGQPDTVAQPQPAAWSGDPVWLPDVLRAAGLQCDIYPGAMDRGHGDFGQIWGIVCHHTGSFGETPKGIAEHPTLGLASQLYLSRDGKYTLCGVGIAWHAGQGAYPGLPANNANGKTIGIEAANDGGGTPGKPHRTGWSDAQYNAYVTGVAAILNRLGQPASHAIGHKEWAGAAQGKWDPGAIDMNVFRGDVAAKMIVLTAPKTEVPPVPQPQPPARQFPKDYTDRELLEWIVAQLGDGDPAWPSKGMTLRDKVWTLDKDAS